MPDYWWLAYVAGWLAIVLVLLVPGAVVAWLCGGDEAGGGGSAFGDDGDLDLDDDAQGGLWG